MVVQTGEDREAGLLHRRPPLTEILLDPQGAALDFDSRVSRYLEPAAGGDTRRTCLAAGIEAREPPAGRQQGGRAWRQRPPIAHGKVDRVAVDQLAVRKTHAFVAAAELQSVADAKLVLQHGIQPATNPSGTGQQDVRGVQAAQLVGDVRIALDEQLGAAGERTVQREAAAVIEARERLVLAIALVRRPVIEIEAPPRRAQPERQLDHCREEVRPRGIAGNTLRIAADAAHERYRRREPGLALRRGLRGSLLRLGGAGPENGKRRDGSYDARATDSFPSALRFKAHRPRLPIAASARRYHPCR